MRKSTQKWLLALCSIMLMICAVPISFFTHTKTASATQSVITEIEIGQCITLGTYLGEPIVWRCVAIDDNGPLMLSEEILCTKEYDASGKNSYYHSDGWGWVREEAGSNCWSDSNIRQWLNTSGTVEYTHCPPSYANEEGFMSGFTFHELYMIKSVTQKAYLNEWETKRSGYVNGGSQEIYDVWNIKNLNYDYNNNNYNSFLKSKYFTI